jgi:bacillithiol system protein YtxJ
MINWRKIRNESEWEVALEQSASAPVLIFKHSSRCSISAMALYRLEKDWNQESNINPYMIDVIYDRGISNKVAEHFGVRHESPQVLLIEGNICTYNTSHSGITYKGLLNAVNYS